jgi:uncharacterized protein (TIGR02145 family)
MPVYYDQVLMGDGDKMPIYETNELPDGRVYTKIDSKIAVSTVKLPNGMVWTQSNLNKDIAGSVCYDNNPLNCKSYGRLYTYEDANKVCSDFWSSPLSLEKQMRTNGITTKEELQTPAKEEWHLPTKEEWEALINFVGDSSTAGKFLKAKPGFGWEDYQAIEDLGISTKAAVLVKKSGAGEGKYGFNARPGGSRSISSSGDGKHIFENIGKFGSWWTSSESHADSAYFCSMGQGNGAVCVIIPKGAAAMLSVRCIKGPAPAPASVPVPAKQEAVPEAVPAQTETPEAGETP